MTRYKTGEASKHKIYAAAKKLFYENGFVKTTLWDIAIESGANKAMISYYFDTKNRLALEVYNEYMFAVKAKTQSIVDSIDPNCSPMLRTALEYRIQNRICRQNRHVDLFYHDLCDANVFLQFESASVDFVETLNNVCGLGFSKLDVKAIAIANMATVHALYVARNEGFMDCSGEYLAETGIRLLFQSLKIDNTTIDLYLSQSAELLEQIKLTVGKNFNVK